MNDFLYIDDCVDATKSITEVSSIAVCNGNYLLMGKRRDDHRWTLPGGKLDEGEEKTFGAVRELKEETGIESEVRLLEHLGTERVISFTGKPVVINAFQLKTDGPRATSKFDPDKEVERWEWINVENGLPKEIAENLHSPKNVTLRLMKLQKALFFLDLIKADRPGHKYIRKYRKGDKWVYIYYNKKGRPSALQEEHVTRLQRLAELGHEGARTMHEGIEEIPAEKLDALRRLADLGHEGAKEHLKGLGINREKEKLESQLIPGEPETALTRKLPEDEKSRIENAIQSVLHRKVFGYLGGHRESPFHTSLASAGITEESIREAAKGNSLKKILEGLHKGLKKIDEAHAPHGRSQNSEAANAGGYGNLAYNQVIKNLEEMHILPEGYNELHKRTGAEMPELINPEEMLARQRQAEQERMERERRELGELKGSMAYHIMSQMSLSRGENRAQKARQIDQTIKAIFGESLKKEDWPYDFSEQGLKVKITSCNARGDYIDFSFHVTDAQGNVVTERWDRQWSKTGRGPQIYNSILVVQPSARNGARIGELINKSQQKFLMKVAPTNGEVHVTAALDVGGYNWCNQGFSFESEGSARGWRSEFKSFLSRHGINLTEAQMQSFKEPCHFAAFHDGKFYEKQLRTSIPLSPKQIETRSLSGVAGEMPLTSAEIRTGKAARMAVHLGKLFMLGQNWHGVWRARDRNQTEAGKFFEHYSQMRLKAVEHLSAAYQKVLTKVREERIAGGATRNAEIRDTSAGSKAVKS